MPADIQNSLFPDLELISMPLGKVLYESGDVMRYVYFPLDCIISLLYVMENGASAFFLGKRSIKSISAASVNSGWCWKS